MVVIQKVSKDLAIERHDDLTILIYFDDLVKLLRYVGIYRSRIERNELRPRDNVDIFRGGRNRSDLHSAQIYFSCCCLDIPNVLFNDDQRANIVRLNNVNFSVHLLLEETVIVRQVCESSRHNAILEDRNAKVD